MGREAFQVKHPSTSRVAQEGVKAKQDFHSCYDSFGKQGGRGAGDIYGSQIPDNSGVLLLFLFK